MPAVAVQESDPQLSTAHRQLSDTTSSAHRTGTTAANRASQDGPLGGYLGSAPAEERAQTSHAIESRIRLRIMYYWKQSARRMQCQSPWALGGCGEGTKERRLRRLNRYVPSLMSGLVQRHGLIMCSQARIVHFLLLLRCVVARPGRL